MNYTASGDPSPYARADAAGKTLELRLDSLDGPVIQTSVVKPDQTYSLPLPALTAEQLGSADVLPSRNLPEFTESCVAQPGSLSDPSVKVRLASLDLVFPTGLEPLTIVQNSGDGYKDSNWTYYSQSLAGLIYVDKEVTDSAFTSCDGPIVSPNTTPTLYYRYGSLLNLKPGWNIIITEVTISQTSTGFMTTVGVHQRATQDLEQYLMSAR